jgi:hypothetical protein
MNTNYEADTIPPASAKRAAQSAALLFGGIALVGGIALAGLGLGSATAHAAPSPAPRGSLCFDTFGMANWCSDY